MTALTSKYQPHRIRDFAGLARAKAIMGKLVANPYPSAWLFTGGPGQGKTTMGLAVAAEMNGELHHIPARTCTLENIQRVCDECHAYPGFLVAGAANFLFGVWYRETGGNTAGAPVMRDLIAGNGCNIRGALMALEMELAVQEVAA